MDTSIASNNTLGLRSVKEIPRKPKRDLTPEEDRIQMEKSRYHRLILRNVVRDTRDAIQEVRSEPRIGLLLSGGVDSVTILWEMLDAGIKPHVYTFRIPQTESRPNGDLGSDAEKAIKLARRYGLSHTVVDLPYDSDVLAEFLIHTYRTYGADRMKSTPDFEVLTIIRQIFLTAHEEGMTDLFLGIGDGDIHLVGKKNEIRGLYRGFTQNEVDGRRISPYRSTQILVIQQMAADLGMAAHFPHTLVAHMQPYQGVSWEVTNFPVLKAVSMRAYEKEQEEADIKVVVKPLQTGDTGSREYFDGRISDSSFAREVAGKEITSAVVLYNVLNPDRINGRKDRVLSFTQTEWDWFSHVTEGAEVFQEDARPLLTRGSDDIVRAELPEELKEVIENGPDPFSPFDLDDMAVLDEEGTPDSRIDCFGNAFYQGASTTCVTCPRALAGLCGEYKPENPSHIRDCSIWGNMTRNNKAAMEEMRDMYAEQPFQAMWQKYVDLFQKYIAEGKASEPVFTENS